MNLIDILAAGIRGCENGTVAIRKRGQSARATYYKDWAGTIGVTPTADLTLDSNGGISDIYVNEEVDCVAKDSSGNTVRTFTVGSNSPSVEVVSQSFTGTDYATAASAASKPTTLQAALDLWKTQNGAIDWQVLVNGSSKTIQAAVAGLSGLFFNVKDPAYGAKGDGTTDDAGAIDAAVAAAHTAGGGIVFFPPGTYRRTTAMVMTGDVDLMGCGPSASYIKLDAASADLLQYTTGTKDWQTVQGLRLGNAQANGTNKTLIRIAGATRLRVNGCYVGDSNVLGGCLYMTNASALAELYACTLECGTSATNPIQTSSGKRVGLYGNRFVMPATFNGTVVSMATCDIVAIGNDFENGTVSVGTFTCIACASGQRAAIVGNNFQAGVGATITAISFGSVDGEYEFANRFGTGVAAYVYTASVSAATHSGSVNLTREGREEFVAAGGGATVTLHSDQYKTSSVTATTAAAQTWSVGSPLYPGQDWDLVVNNTAGAPTGTITMALYGLASFTVNANRASLYRFTAVNLNGSISWALIGSQLNFVP